MVSYWTLALVVYAVGFLVTLSWAGTHKANFPGTSSRADVFLQAFIWPIMAGGLFPLMIIAMRDDI